VKRRAIDANILLRYVTADHPEMSPRCRRLIERVEAGEEAIFLPEAAMADVAWTLRSLYRWPAERICAFFGDLLALDGVEMTRKDMMWGAIELYREGKIDYSDALIAAEMGDQGVDEIYSFDRDFNHVPKVKRVEP
jgi:predicted nucleic-acid-binding protein